MQPPQGGRKRFEAFEVRGCERHLVAGNAEQRAILKSSRHAEGDCAWTITLPGTMDPWTRPAHEHVA